MNAAREAIEPEDVPLAASLLLLPAISGNLEAQFLLGYLYFSSPDLDLAESRHSLEHASPHDHADALFHLSTLHSDGSTGLPDRLHRRSLLIKAADLGSQQAQPDKGCNLATGEGACLTVLALDVYGTIRLPRGGMRTHNTTMC